MIDVQFAVLGAMLLLGWLVAGLALTGLMRVVPASRPRARIAMLDYLAVGVVAATWVTVESFRRQGSVQSPPGVFLAFLITLFGWPWTGLWLLALLPAHGGQAFNGSGAREAVTESVRLAVVIGWGITACVCGVLTWQFHVRSRRALLAMWGYALLAAICASWLLFESAGQLASTETMGSPSTGQLIGRFLLYLVIWPFDLPFRIGTALHR